jgi:hypothetical protein
MTQALGARSQLTRTNDTHALPITIDRLAERAAESAEFGERYGVQ